MLEVFVVVAIVGILDVVKDIVGILVSILGNVKGIISFQHSQAVSTLMISFKQVDIKPGMQVTAHFKARLVGCTSVAAGQGLSRNEAAKSMD